MSENPDDGDKPEQDGKSRSTPPGSAWLVISIGVGVALGTALDNIGVGIAIGVAVGAALMTAQNRSAGKK